MRSYAGNHEVKAPVDTKPGHPLWCDLVLQLLPMMDNYAGMFLIEYGKQSTFILIWLGSIHASPLLTTSSIGRLSSLAMYPRIAKMTKPPKILVSMSPVATTMVSLQSERALDFGTGTLGGMYDGDQPKTIVVEFVVTGQCDEASPAEGQWEESLYGSISPHLE